MPDRRPWTPQEDQALKYLRQQVSINKWSLISKKLAQDYGMYGRTGKQCRQRYHNHLDATILHTEWTREEEIEMYKLHDEFGNKWAIISQKLSGRTDNCVKNHFYSRLRKAIRKLNKTIHDHFRRQFKEIKITILYKIIQAADEKFKSYTSIDESVSEICCNLKNMLLSYSNDNENQLQYDLVKTKMLIKSIYEFSSGYRRKPKRCRKTSSHAHDLLKFSKFQKKVKSFSDQQQSEEQYSMIFSQSSNFHEEIQESHFKKFGNENALQEEEMEKENQMKNEQIDEKNEILIEQIFYDREIEIPFMNKRSSVDSQNFEEKQLRNNILEDQSMIDEKNFSHNLDYLSEDDSKIFTVNF